MVTLLRELPHDSILPEAACCMERLQVVESTVDTRFHEPLSRIFQSPANSIRVIKTRDLLQEMEDTIDEIQRAGKTVSSAMQR